MNAKRNQLAYQEAAVRNASPIELVIMLYEFWHATCMPPLKPCMLATSNCVSAKLKHGFLALQQLEGSLNLDEGGELATNMSRFYSMLRGEIMKAQVRQDAAVLEELFTYCSVCGKLGWS